MILALRYEARVEELELHFTLTLFSVFLVLRHQQQAQKENQLEAAGFEPAIFLTQISYLAQDRT